VCGCLSDAIRADATSFFFLKDCLFHIKYTYNVHTYTVGGLSRGINSADATSLVARSSRGRFAQPLHDLQHFRDIRQIHAGCASHPRIRRKCCEHLPRATRDVTFGPPYIHNFSV
jgi:hypothetical protein